MRMHAKLAGSAVAGKMLRQRRREPAMSVQQTNQRIDGVRLWDSLMEMARIGATPRGGVRRLALTEPDRQGRDRFRAWCEAAGLVVRVDAIGNIFARREGRDPARAPVLFGSHLDSQPSGGKFDGALGVLAGLEVMRTLNDLGIVTEAPLELVNWTDEEGSRFGYSLLGSGVWAGVYPIDRAWELTDLDGVTAGAALDRIGYAGEASAQAFPADSYFELHIEQGPILEAEGDAIGIVTGAQALVWYDAVALGQDSHAGTTPPSARRDALVATARVIALVNRTMRDHGEDGRGTVGQLVVSPNSRNVIPGEVSFSVEFRHPDTAAILCIAEAFPPAAIVAAAECGVKLELTELFRNAAVQFDPECVAQVAAAAAKCGYPARKIVSGAGHDAVYVARHVPTAMIFTPCKDGLSHNEAESIEPGQAEAGCRVLFEAVLARANRRSDSAGNSSIRP
jgi:N-carbamoyl-L-amino-acid hydrolase